MDSLSLTVKNVELHKVLPWSICTSKMVGMFHIGFCSLTFPEPKVLKLIHDAYYHKTHIKNEFGWLHFNLSRDIPLYKEKKMLYLSFLFSNLSLPQWNVMKLSHNAYNLQIQRNTFSKTPFWPQNIAV